MHFDFHPHSKINQFACQALNSSLFECLNKKILINRLFSLLKLSNSSPEHPCSGNELILPKYMASKSN